MKLEEALNNFIKESNVDTNLISDGFHTFEELYEHRIALFIALCAVLIRLDSETRTSKLDRCWKSKLHSDGTMFEGWFVAGIEQDKGYQITYHLPLKYWDKLDSPVIDKAPEWDGHTPEDVIKRLYEL